MLELGNGKYNNKSDIWALGYVPFEMVTGRKRFEHDYAVIQHVFTPTPLPQEPPFGPYLSYFLVSELLEINPTKRPSAPRLKSLVRLMGFALPIHHPQEAMRSTALSLAITLNRRDVVEVILTEIPHQSTWWFSVNHQSLDLALDVDGETDIADVIFSSGVTMNIAEAARYSASNGFVRAITRLIARGLYDPHLDNTGDSCLDHAIHSNHARIASLLHAAWCPCDRRLVKRLSHLLRGLEVGNPPFSVFVYSDGG
jgi:serine/threonine protein kinase